MAYLSNDEVKRVINRALGYVELAPSVEDLDVSYGFMRGYFTALADLLDKED